MNPHVARKARDSKTQPDTFEREEKPPDRAHVRFISPAKAIGREVASESPARDRPPRAIKEIRAPRCLCDSVVKLERLLSRLAVTKR